MPPDLGVSDKAHRRGRAAGRSTRACSTGGGRVLQLVRPGRRAGTPGGVRRRRAPRAGPPGRGRVRRAAQERRRRAAAAGRGTVAVLGEFARTPRYQGAGSSQVNPTRVDTALDALHRGAARRAGRLRRRLPARRPGRRRRGAGRRGGRAGRAAPTWSWPASGCRPIAESEGYDRTHIDLPPASSRCSTRWPRPRRVPVVVVLANGSAVRTSALGRPRRGRRRVLAGRAGRRSAVADVLTGAVNPSGRLAETIPLRLAGHSASLNFPGEDGHVRYGEGVFVGYRGYDARTARWPTRSGTGCPTPTLRLRRPVGDRSARSTAATSRSP